jgi:hypothetical protein
MMKTEVVTWANYCGKNVTSEDRVLLINPPVIETRYQWLRWNQPLDLLRLSSFLKEQIGCEVKLFDFMLPNGGRVPRTSYKPKPEIKVGQQAYPLWRYGESNQKFKSWLAEALPRWRPTKVLITSLTSYWWIGLSDTITLIKNIVPDAITILYGQYPILETEHAQRNSYADFIVTDKCDISNSVSDFSLYLERKPAFCALDVNAKNWPNEVSAKIRLGVHDFAFFNDDILANAKEFLGKLVCLTKELPSGVRKTRFHAICGLYPRSFTHESAGSMKEAGFTELHFEAETDGEDLDLDSHRRARESYEHAGFQLDADQLSGFQFIGLPSDDLVRISRQMLNLLELWGTVILKPYTPTPGTLIHDQYKSLLDTEEIERQSPHLFPFSEVNGICPVEYDELYTLAAALNQKVRNRPFNAFPGTLGYDMIRTSLEREVWRLGNEESTAY